MANNQQFYPSLPQQPKYFFSRRWLLVITGALIVILGVGGFLGWRYFVQRNANMDAQTVVKLEGLQSYTDEKNVYTIHYPFDWRTENLLEESGSPYYSMRIFAENPGNISYLNNGIVVVAAFSKLPLEMFMRYGASLAQPFLDALDSSQELTIDGKNGLLLTVDSAKGFNRLAAVKNNDFVIFIFIGSDYKKEVYNNILKNIKLIAQEKPFVQKREAISTENWELYTDSPFGNNPIWSWRAVPDWSLSMKFPSNFKGSEGVFSILEEETQEPSGVELQVWVKLYGGELEEKLRALITQYRDMAPGDAVRDSYSQLVVKIGDINTGGCVGPQIFSDRIGGDLNIHGYKTLCLLGDDIGRTTVFFSLQADSDHAELLDEYKPLYDTILSTFRYEPN